MRFSKDGAGGPSNGPSRRSYPSLSGISLDGDRQGVELDCLGEAGVQRDDVTCEVRLELIDEFSDAARRWKIVVAHCSVHSSAQFTAKKLNPAGVEKRII